MKTFQTVSASLARALASLAREWLVLHVLLLILIFRISGALFFLRLSLSHAVFKAESSSSLVVTDGDFSSRVR